MIGGVPFGPIFHVFCRPRFWIDFLTILASRLDQFWSHVRQQITEQKHHGEKTRLPRNVMFPKVLFMIVGAVGPQNRDFFGPGTHFSDLRKRHRLFHSFWAEQNNQHGPKIEAKMVPRSRVITARSTCWATKVPQGPPDDPQGPKVTPQGRKMRPRFPQSEPQGPQNDFRRSKNDRRRSKMTPDGPKMDPTTDKPYPMNPRTDKPGSAECA